MRGQHIDRQSVLSSRTFTVANREKVNRGEDRSDEVLRKSEM